MSKVTASTDFDRVKPEDLPKFLSLFGEQVVQVLNNGLDFQSNFNCALISVTFSAANTDTAVSHGLGRVPTGYLIYSRSTAMDVYDGVTAWTSDTLYLRTSTTGTIGVIVF